MHLSVENKVRLAFGAGLICLLLTSAAAYWSVHHSVATFRLLRQSETVVDLLRTCQAGVLDVETAARGFAISGGSQFLEPVEVGQSNVASAVQGLREALSADLQQRQDLEQLERLISEKMAESAGVIELRKLEGAEAAAGRVATGRGRQLMDAIRNTIAAMERNEREALAHKSEDMHTVFRRALTIVTVSGITGVLVVIVASVLSHRDFAKRRAAEEERDRFFNLTHDLVCFAGFDGYFKSLNPAWEKTLGYSRQELVSRPFIEFVHPEDRERTEMEAAKLTRGDDSISFENRYRTKDGTYRWLCWNARASAPQHRVYATARDVTDQRIAAEEIERLNLDLQRRAQQLEEANKELEAFSYSVSHDLRAPLRHIHGFADRLQKTTAVMLDDKARRYIQIISESAQQMGQLIDDLLVFSRMGRSELQHQKVPLDVLTRDIINLLDHEMQPRVVTWRRHPLPEVQGDASMLRQVLLNLLSNAAKYTRTRERAEIEIGCTESAEEYIIFVRDNGVGFEMEYVHKLFGVFQRLHRSDEFEGTGIGLANVRRIIHRHGGRTWAEGKVNAGATFYFSLPKTKKEKSG